MLNRTLAAAAVLVVLILGCAPSEPEAVAEPSCPSSEAMKSMEAEEAETLEEAVEVAEVMAEEAEVDVVVAEEEAGAQDDIPSLVVPVPGTAPEIDGSLDDAAWADAPVVSTSFIWGGQEKPQQKTEIRVLADKDAIYVAYTCSESHMSEISGNVKERDGTVWEDDVVELFLLPGQVPSSDYYHVLVNSANTVADEKAKNLDAWNAENVKSAVKTYEDHWVTEIRLPWSDLKIEGELPSKWRGNFTRTRPGKGMTYFEDQAWSPTLLDTSHVPERFGYLTIEAFE